MFRTDNIKFYFLGLQKLVTLRLENVRSLFDGYTLKVLLAVRHSISVQ
jgi:hypothetical protein